MDHILKHEIDTLNETKKTLINLAITNSNIVITCVTYCLNKYDEERKVTADIKEVLLAIASHMNEEVMGLLKHMYEEIGLGVEDK